MSTPADGLAETHIVGSDTQQEILRSSECSALQSVQIDHVGVCDAAEPYKIVRTKLSGAFLLGTVEGEGAVLLDGRWRSHHAGVVSLAPASSLHAFHAVPGVRWKTCWVRFTHEASISRSKAIMPLVGDFDCRPLMHAICGLQREANSPRDPSSLMLWVELILHYVKRFTTPPNRDQRLDAVFSAVQQDIARPWTVRELAARGNLSTEHLRRLCVNQLGRSPMQQVTALRMQRATHLLASTEHKIETIASDVGYENPFAFSNTFKKITGFRPSKLRSKYDKSEPGAAN